MIPFGNYLRIGNSTLCPEDAAKQIKDCFCL